LTESDVFFSRALDEAFMRLQLRRFQDNYYKLSRMIEEDASLDDGSMKDMAAAYEKNKGNAFEEDRSFFFGRGKIWE
jgi:hypothetical protein